jgi:hypothetical protein
VTDTQLTVRFTVRVPAGGSATCGIRARDYAGAEVGRRTVTLTAPASATRIDATEVITTRAKAAVGEVVRCAAAS